MRWQRRRKGNRRKGGGKGRERKGWGRGGEDGRNWALKRRWQRLEGNEKKE